MNRGAYHSPATRRGILAFRILALLTGLAVVTGELVLAGHGACRDHVEGCRNHVEHPGDAVHIVASCSLCAFEAARPSEARPSPLHRAVLPLPWTTLLVSALPAARPQELRLAGPAAPRAPPTA